MGRFASKGKKNRSNAVKNNKNNDEDFRADFLKDEYYGIVTKKLGDIRFYVTILLHNHEQMVDQVGILRGTMRNRRPDNFLDIGSFVLTVKDQGATKPQYYILMKYNEKQVSILRQEHLLPSSDDSDPYFTTDSDVLRSLLHDEHQEKVEESENLDEIGIGGYNGEADNEDWRKTLADL